MLALAAAEGGLASKMRCRHCGLESPPGLRFCGGCGGRLEGGSVTDPPPGMAGAGQKRHMTVLFCDLVDSTPLAGSLDPEDWRDVLSAYQHVCVRAIERFDGYTAQYLGDGVVAYFGYPRAHEDDAQRAVHAGLGIVDELVAVDEYYRERLGISLQARVGLHTGVVVVGEMGAGEARSQHGIVGETPHIAARLQSVAVPGSVVVSADTRDLIEGYFETESLGEKELKGVSRAIGVYRALRPTGAVGRLEVAGARRMTPVMGRDRELERLTDAWRQAASGNGGIVHVTGQAGIGKSRLVHALREGEARQAAEEQVWQCSAHHDSTSLYPVIRLLERMLGFERADTPGQRMELLQQAVADAGLDTAEAVPLAAELLSIGGVTGSSSLAPREARTATLRILESLLVTDPARHPLLLVVEDVHWADPTTVELLGRIAGSLANLPVLCVLTFRPEFEPPWSQRPQVLEIELGPLTSREVRAMATAASDTTLDPSILDWLDTAADGVPLFVEEMLKMHAAGGVPSATTVPPTLDGLLTERLDRLPDLADVIDVAAVLGREFDRALLGVVASRNGDLEPAFAQLGSQDVLRPVVGLPGRWEFTHALLQEAAYRRILRRRRHALHGQVADTLVRSFPDVAQREPEVVAYHWSCADEPARAMHFWYAAGTRALEGAAYLEAAEHFRRGLEALDETDAHTGDELERVEFLTHLAASLQAGHGYAAAGVDEAYARARTACERTRNDDRMVAVIRGQWMSQLLRGHYGTALELADEMLALGQRDDHPARLAEGHLYLGLVHMYLANFDVARERLDDAFARYRRPERSDHIYEAQGDTEVGALAYVALVLWNLGHAEESSERSDLSLERAARVGGPVTRAQAWGMRSFLHLSRTEMDEFGHWVEKTRAHSIDHDIGYWRAVSSLLAGWLRGRAGDLAVGTARVEQSLEAYLRSGSRLGLPHLQVLLADLRLAAGDRRGALDVILAGEEYMEETGERFSASELFRFKGRALMAGDSPDPEGAGVAYEAAVRAAREQNAKLLELRSATRLVEHRRALGEPCSAIGRLGALCDWFGAKSELGDVVRARNLVASGTMSL